MSTIPVSRKEIRRPVYIGGKLSCILESSSLTGKADVVDLSALGLAVVLPAESAKTIPIVGDKVSLNFSRKDIKPFQCDAEIRNVAEIAYRKSKLLRLGMRYIVETSDSPESFRKSIGRQNFHCDPVIRPQVGYQDPFLFNEQIVCHVNSFTNEGMELLWHLPSKIIFPNQVLEFQIYIPGQGFFKVSGTTSRKLQVLKDGAVARYVLFNNPSAFFLEAISQYLVMFQKKATPEALRKEAFPIGKLNQAFSTEYSSPVEDFIKRDGFEPTLFARPINKGNFILPFSARPVSCQMGENFVAIFGVLFVDKDKEKSVLLSQGHQISEAVLKAGHIELIELFLTPSVILADCFLLILQQAIRIAYQASIRFICFEATPKVSALLKRIGLREGGLSMFTDTESKKIASAYFELDLSKFPGSDEPFLTDAIWKQFNTEITEIALTQMGEASSSGSSTPPPPKAAGPTASGSPSGSNSAQSRPPLSRRTPFTR